MRVKSFVSKCSLIYCLIFYKIFKLFFQTSQRTTLQDCGQEISGGLRNCRDNRSCELHCS